MPLPVLPSGAVAHGSAAALESNAYKEFDEYPWATNREYLTVLLNILGGPSNVSNDAAPKGTVLWSRIVYYEKETGIHIDKVQYDAFVARTRQPSFDVKLLEALDLAAKKASEFMKDSPNNTESYMNSMLDAVPESLSRQQQASISDWQQAAPRKALQVDGGGAVGGGSPDDEAPGPGRFAQVMEAVTTGKPVSGIRQIPNTIVRLPGVSALGKMVSPRKPWEKVAAAAVPATESEYAMVDEQFPPIEDAWTARGNEERGSANSRND